MDKYTCHNQNTSQNTPRQPLTATFLVNRSRTVHGAHASALALRAPRLSRYRGALRPWRAGARAAPGRPSPGPSAAPDRRQRLRRPGPVSPSMRIASRSAMPWGAPRAPPVVRGPLPGARRRRSPPRLRLPTRPCRPDQPGRDPVRRALWPPDRSDRPRSGPHAPVDGRSAAHVVRSAPLSGSQAARQRPSVLRSGRDRRTTGLHGPSCRPRTSPRAGARPAAGPPCSLPAACADRSGTPGHAPRPPLSSRRATTGGGPIAPRARAGEVSGSRVRGSAQMEQWNPAEGGNLQMGPTRGQVGVAGVGIGK